MKVAFQRMFGILEQWNNNKVTPSLRKPHELSYRSNTIIKKTAGWTERSKAFAKFYNLPLTQERDKFAKTNLTL